MSKHQDFQLAFGLYSEVAVGKGELQHVTGQRPWAIALSTGHDTVPGQLSGATVYSITFSLGFS
jgi:hypothetical protein